ncbi:MAG: response regulator [Nitrospirae bacterium]|nr:response regulator [Nitrospirota bacterium]
MPKVLIADDSMAVRKVAERLLVQAGLEVALASSGEEALAWLAKERADVIISDVIMPGRSGYDVCTFVRSQAGLADTPVLLISGIVNDEVAKQVELCRANGVLKKPFQGSSLQDKVKELLTQRQQAAPAAEPEPMPVAAAAPPVFTPPPPPSSPAPVMAAAPAFVPPPPPASSSAFDPTQTAKIDLSQTTKVYRITEDKLQAFRQAVARVKDLEAALAEEQAQSARLYEQLETAGQHGGGERVQQLEAMLAEEQQRSAQLAKRAEELERALVTANERVGQIAKLLQPGG